MMTELSNVSLKKKNHLNVTKVQSCVMLVLLNMTMKPSNIRKKKKEKKEEEGTTECD